MEVLVPDLTGTMQDLSSLAAITRDEETREELAREERGGTEASASLHTYEKKRGERNYVCCHNIQLR